VRLLARRGWPGLRPAMTVFLSCCHCRAKTRQSTPPAFASDVS
jgi:hypothetical protein